MKPDEAKKMTIETAMQKSWDSADFIICPGRYYHGMASINIGPSGQWMPFGGDLVFRNEEFQRIREWAAFDHMVECLPDTLPQEGQAGEVKPSPGA